MLLGAGVLLWLLRDRWDTDRWIEIGNTLPIPLLLAAFLTLPLLGFPITVFLVLAGMRFGLAGGMAVSTVCIFFHNAVAYKVTHSTFRRRLRAWFEKHGKAIPPVKKECQALYTALFAVVSGPPYSLKLYLFALSDVPFRIYLWVGAPAYAAFSLIPVAAGAAATEIKGAWIVALVGATIALALGSRWLVRRLGRRIDVNPEEPAP